MQEVITYFIGKFPDFLEFLSSCVIVPGVTLLGVMFGFFIVCYLLHTLLLRN